MTDSGSSSSALSRAPERFVRSGWWKPALAAALLAGSTVAWVLFARVPAPTAADAAVSCDGDLEEPPVANPGYVGAQACAACHAERVTECQSTNHFRTFRVPDPAAMPAGFEAGKQLYRSQHPGLRFEMSRSGNEYFQTQICTTADGEERSPARIDLVLGAGGKADEVYLTWHEGRLYELPVAWLFTFDCWGSSHVSAKQSGHALRESTLRCLECHNTWFAHVPGTLNEYRPDSFLMGVTCENCHGPGREHVAYHEAHPAAEAAEKIVRPARLSRERKIELCTQCHSNAMLHRGPAFSHRPGQPLEADYKTLLAPRYTEDDHVANQIKYLRQSKCFQQSEEMTCTTCHNPHRPEPATVSGRDACFRCHQPADCGAQEQLPAAVRDNCAGCHMPPYIKINVNFETADDDYVPPIRRCDHRIAVHPRARQEVLREWFRSQPDAASRDEALSLTHTLAEEWLAEAETCRQDHRLLGSIAALREAYRIDPVPETREKIRRAVAAMHAVDAGFDEAVLQLGRQQYSAAIERLERVLRVKPDLAKAHGRLGTAYAAIGRQDAAVEHLQAVEKFDPDSPYGQGMLGWMAYLRDDAQQAADSFERADALEPYNALTNYHWGLALAKLGKWDQAAARFEQAVTIDPRQAGSWQGLSLAQQHRGRAEVALCAARRAARLTRFENPDVLLTLIDACADAGRPGEARDAAAKALAAAQARAPELVPRIRRRIDELPAGAPSPKVTR
jgi:tetratricopeptide (TPR) repeat protein